MKKTALLILMLCVGSAMSLKAQNTDVSAIDNVLYIEPFSVDKGTTEYDLSVCMKNTAAIRGFQFDLVLPEGVTPLVEDEVISCWFEDRAPTYKKGKNLLNYHSLDAKEQEDGSYRFLSGATEDKTFDDNDGVLFTLQLVIDENLAEGDYPIIMKNVKLSESDISKYYLTEEVVSTMTYGTSTGINGISAKKAVNGVYNVAGQKGELQKGINIVDGKKVMVK